MPRWMRNRVAQRRATALRKQLTDCERHLWHFLRRCHVDGHRFRRQVPIGPCIVDFACLSRALIVELDGGHHADQQAYDQRRDSYLRSQGFRVLRFRDNDVLSNTDGVLEVIRNELTRPLPVTHLSKYISDDAVC